MRAARVQTIKRLCVFSFFFFFYCFWFLVIYIYIYMSNSRQLSCYIFILKTFVLFFYIDMKYSYCTFVFYIVYINTIWILLLNDALCVQQHSDTYQWAMYLRSDCADAQADFELQCLYISDYPFSHNASLIETMFLIVALIRLLLLLTLIQLGIMLFADSVASDQLWFPCSLMRKL